MEGNLIYMVVALVALFVGVAGTAAFALSERTQRTSAKSRAEGTAQLSADALAVLAVVRPTSILVDPQDKVIRADASARLLGLVKDDFIAVEQIAAQVKSVRRLGTVFQGEFEINRPPISTFSIRVAPLTEGLILVLADDLTKERRVDAIRRDFTANVSHELKTPVGAIRLLAETIDEAADDHDSVRYFSKRLQVETERLSHLIQDVIELSRLQDSDPLGSPVLVDLDRVLQEALDRTAVPAESANISLIGPHPSGIKVWGSPDLLNTAVRNLLDNAVRYSSAGTAVTLNISLLGAALVQIQVSDQGVGMTPEQQERVFERFYRVDPARSRETGGTGLGLSIVKHIVADHGGSIGLTSVPGKGSTFSIRLPVAVRQECGSAEISTVSAGSPATSSRAKGADELLQREPPGMVHSPKSDCDLVIGNSHSTCKGSKNDNNTNN